MRSWKKLSKIELITSFSTFLLLACVSFSGSAAAAPVNYYPSYKLAPETTHDLLHYAALSFVVGVLILACNTMLSATAYVGQRRRLNRLNAQYGESFASK